MSAPKITPMQRKTLEALAAAENGTLTFEEMRKACRATIRGHRIVRMNLEDAGLIERAPYGGRPSMTITQAGREAIRS